MNLIIFHISPLNLKIIKLVHESACTEMCFERVVFYNYKSAYFRLIKIISKKGHPIPTLGDYLEWQNYQILYLGSWIPLKANVIIFYDAFGFSFCPRVVISDLMTGSTRYSHQLLLRSLISTYFHLSPHFCILSVQWMSDWVTHLKIHWTY